MKTSLWACVVILLPSLGCTVFDSGGAATSRGVPAALCNTPGRKALVEEITTRGGLVKTGGASLALDERLRGRPFAAGMPAGESKWDDSVDADVKASMGPPLSEVVMPQDKFSVQEVENARLTFPEAQISTPATLDDYHAEHSPDDSVSN